MKRFKDKMGTAEAKAIYRQRSPDSRVPARLVEVQTELRAVPVPRDEEGDRRGILGLPHSQSAALLRATTSASSVNAAGTQWAAFRIDPGETPSTETEARAPHQPTFEAGPRACVTCTSSVTRPSG